MNKVWIVEQGEKYEGGRVVGVFLSEQSAIACAISQEFSFLGGWKETQEKEFWENGCDYVKVTCFKVEP